MKDLSSAYDELQNKDSLLIAFEIALTARWSREIELHGIFGNGSKDRRFARDARMKMRRSTIRSLKNGESKASRDAKGL